MSRNTSTRFAKPMLEQLEERSQPSVLFGTQAVQQLALPLNNIVKDIQSAQTDLHTQYNLLHTPQTPALTLGQGEEAFAKGAADWQRIQNDQDAIQAFSGAAVKFINAVAFSEAVNGDVTDLIVLRFGGLFGLHPLKPLTEPVTQANNILNDPNVQTWVHTDFYNTSPIYTHDTFAEVAPAPANFIPL